MHRLFPLILVAIFAAGCAPELDTGTGDGIARGPLTDAEREGSCEEVCDGPAPVGNCWCDDDCELYGDCCADRDRYCEADEVEEGDRTCGGPQGGSCGDAQFCYYDREESLCGMGKLEGSCRDKPEACTRLYNPVCGCDGRTYGNRCMAHQAGVNVTAEAACEELDEAPPAGEG